MRYFLHGAVVTAFALMSGSCSDAPSKDETDANRDAGADGALHFGPDERVADLSDAEIDAICDPVERRVDVECGTDPETGEPFVIRETSGKRDCVAAIERMRDAEDGCMRAAGLAECWRMDACERVYGEGCELTCPEREACWTYGVDECESEGGEWCYVREGSRWYPDRGCYQGEPAYCAPSAMGCASATTTTLDDEGNCWWMNSICAVPDDWTNETDERSCPYDRTDLDCP